MFCTLAGVLWSSPVLPACWFWSFWTCARAASFLAVVVVVLHANLGILSCCGWVRDFVQWLRLCGVVVETVIVHYGSLALDYCQWMEQLRPMGVNLGVAMVVHTVVLTANLPN